MNRLTRTSLLAAFLVLMLGHDSVASAQGASCDLSDPPPGSTTVEVGIFLIDVPKVIDIEQAFTADFFGIVRWRDPRLVECPEVDQDSLWLPEFLISNQRTARPVSAPSITVTGDQVHARRRFFGDLSSPLDLREFPLDRQSLVVDVAVLDPTGRVSIEASPELSGRNEGLTVPGWILGAGSAVNHDLRINDAISLSAVRFAVEARRDASFFGWKVILPMLRACSPTSACTAISWTKRRSTGA